MSCSVQIKTRNTVKTKKVNNVIHLTTSETLRLGEPEILINNTSRQILRDISPPMLKKSSCSFQITGVSLTQRTDFGEDSADDFDESHTDDNSRVTDNETPSFSEDTCSKDTEDNYIETCSALCSVTVLPTSELALLASSSITCDNIEQLAILGEEEFIMTTPTTKTVGRRCPGTRFTIVKVETETPILRGRWKCIDYLDNSILTPKHALTYKSPNMEITGTNPPAHYTMTPTTTKILTIQDNLATGTTPHLITQPGQQPTLQSTQPSMNIGQQQLVQGMVPQQQGNANQVQTPIYSNQASPIAQQQVNIQSTGYIPQTSRASQVSTQLVHHSPSYINVPALNQPTPQLSGYISQQTPAYSNQAMGVQNQSPVQQLPVYANQAIGVQGQNPVQQQLPAYANQATGPVQQQLSAYANQAIGVQGQSPVQQQLPAYANQAIGVQGQSPVQQQLPAYANQAIGVQGQRPVQQQLPAYASQAIGAQTQSPVQQRSAYTNQAIGAQSQSPVQQLPAYANQAIGAQTQSPVQQRSAYTNQAIGAQSQSPVHQLPAYANQVIGAQTQSPVQQRSAYTNQAIGAQSQSPVQQLPAYANQAIRAQTQSPVQQIPTYANQAIGSQNQSLSQQIPVYASQAIGAQTQSPVRQLPAYANQATGVPATTLTGQPSGYISQQVAGTLLANQPSGYVSQQVAGTPLANPIYANQAIVSQNQSPSQQIPAYASQAIGAQTQSPVRQLSAYANQATVQATALTSQPSGYISQQVAATPLANQPSGYVSQQIAGTALANQSSGYIAQQMSQVPGVSSFANQPTAAISKEPAHTVQSSMAQTVLSYPNPEVTLQTVYITPIQSSMSQPSMQPIQVSQYQVVAQPLVSAHITAPSQSQVTQFPSSIYLSHLQPGSQMPLIPSFSGMGYPNVFPSVVGYPQIPTSLYFPFSQIPYTGLPLTPITSSITTLTHSYSCETQTRKHFLSSKTFITQIESTDPTFSKSLNQSIETQTTDGETFTFEPQTEPVDFSNYPYGQPTPAHAIDYSRLRKNYPQGMTQTEYLIPTLYERHYPELQNQIRPPIISAQVQSEAYPKGPTTSRTQEVQTDATFNIDEGTETTSLDLPINNEVLVENLGQLPIPTEVFHVLTRLLTSIKTLHTTTRAYQKQLGLSEMTTVYSTDYITSPYVPTKEEFERVDPPTPGAAPLQIDSRIEQAMDLVKIHLLYTVRQEVELLKTRISELVTHIGQLEQENSFLRANASNEVLAALNSRAGAAQTATATGPLNPGVATQVTTTVTTTTASSVMSPQQGV